MVGMVKLQNIEFPSGDITLLGRLYKPEGRTKRPAVAICHGFPGDTKNMDLAEELALNVHRHVNILLPGGVGERRQE